MTQPRLFVRMFKPQFAAQVRDGTKLQTVRPWPQRVPMPGDRLSLRQWSDKPYRSPQVVLREAVVKKTESIHIKSDGRVVLNDYLLFDTAREAFAIADGFTSAAEMIAWFEREHGLPFNGGIVIHWFP